MEDSSLTAGTSAVTGISIRGLGQIMVVASDVQRTVQFYKETLGFAEADEQMLSPGVTLQAGDASIYVTDGGTSHAISTNRAEFRIALIVASAREAYQRAQSSGIPIVTEYDGSDYFASFSIADPDGVVIELWGKP
jgi:catechol 2,3-dioxygenase-like lactoylglutathione lyase family enzyme